LHMHESLESFVVPDRQRVEQVAAQLRLLADPTRLRIVAALAQGETNPSCLAELTGVGIAAVSQHLAKLRLAAVCEARRDGQRVIYELVDHAVRDLVVGLLSTPSSVRAEDAVAGLVRS
jgi:DNA-binding transcriptional ArsR family regulator